MVAMYSPDSSPNSVQRTSSDIVLSLSRSQPPPLLPFELQKYVSGDTWASRVSTIIRTASQYSKPRFERIWFMFGLLAPLILPAALYHLILHSLEKKNNNFDDVLVETRAITFAISICTGLLFFLPMACWKLMGHLRVKAMLDRWATEDIKSATTYAPIPSWKVRTPGVFNENVTLIITLPVAPPPSYFHPDAYLPPYINPPADVPEPGKVKMDYMDSDYTGTKFGDLPLYQDEKYSMA